MPSELSEQLAALRSRVETLERERVVRQARGKRLALAAVVALSLGGSLAWAANGACPNGYPFCFVADQPAQAVEVNTNFAQIKEWVEAKVGTVAAGTPSTSPVTMTRASFGSTTQQTLNLYGTGYGVGVQNSTEYFRSGGGFAWYLNGTHNDAQNNSGGGTTLMTLSSAGGLAISDLSTSSITTTTVNGRRPVYVVTNNCTVGTCAASCGAGVVKFGLGFHGNNPSGNPQFQGGVCGNAVTWMGSCTGQQTCSITTGCGTSGMYLECW